MHPYDYDASLIKFKHLQGLNIFNGEDSFLKKSNSINIVSLYGTLFWKMIVQSRSFICIYPESIDFSIYYNFRLVELLESNRLIYPVGTFLEEINKISFNEIFKRNLTFYNQLRKLL